MHMRHLLFIRLVVLFISGLSMPSAFAADLSCVTHLSGLAKQLHLFGPSKKMAYEIFDNELSFSCLTNHLGENSDANYIVSEIYRYSDAGITFSLNLSIGDALAKEPRRTLEMIQSFSTKKRTPKYITERVCGSVEEGFLVMEADGEKEKWQLIQAAVRKLNKRLLAVSSVENSHLDEVRRPCIAKIEKAITVWERFAKSSGSVHIGGVGPRQDEVKRGRTKSSD